MSTPNGSGPVPTVADPSNPWLMEVPAQLTTEVMNGPTGQRLGMTVRIPNTTVTVLLGKDDALQWADQIRAKVSEMNGLILPG